MEHVAAGICSSWGSSSVVFLPPIASLSVWSNFLWVWAAFVFLESPRSIAADLLDSALDATIARWHDVIRGQNESVANLEHPH